MEKSELKALPRMLYADRRGRIYDHPYLRVAGFSGGSPFPIGRADLTPMPAYSKLFFIPDCPPVGLDPRTGRYVVVPEVEAEGRTSRCCAVAAFPEPGFVRTHLPAADYSGKSYTLPMWAYTAVGFKSGRYWIAGFRVEYSRRWDPANFDDRALVPAIENFKREHGQGPLVDHLSRCATENHCFAAKNLFLGRWEAPLPVSRTCNAACLGCLSLQPEGSCEASHQRIAFRPGRDEIVSLAVRHLESAPEAIVSFGQGCEGEPLTEYRLIAESIRDIRSRTRRGTVNLNTNGSWPDRVREVAQSGLDSIRISINSAQPAMYAAYYRPKGYDFSHVAAAISLCRRMGLYTMVNYLIFPGVSDRQEEVDALRSLIRETGIHFLHLKNLNIDPQMYLGAMPGKNSPPVGIRRMVGILNDEFPELQIGYFNQPVR
jgi:wyosine [tRNA(Phe)-imidazoG37] synthetase (radical SAM superfamily)